MRGRAALSMAVLVLGGFAAASTCAAAVAGANPKFTFGNIACSVSSSGLDFAVYNPLQATNATGTGTLDVTCRLNGGGFGFGYVAATVSVTAGNSGSFASRQMRVGANALNYNLYWDAAHSQVAGDGTGGSFNDPLPGMLLFGGNASFTQPVTIYGSIPARQDVAPGTYRDLLIVTVSY